MGRLAIFVLLGAGVALAENPDERTLARHEIQPTYESIGKYLRSLYPDEAELARIERLVEQLGAPRAAVREFAVEELLRAGSAAAGALKRATEHDEPGVRLRAMRLLEAANENRRAEVLYCVFRTIRGREIFGLIPEIINVMPLAVDVHVRREAREALLTTARTDDLALLLRTAAEGVPTARMACFAAIRTLGGDEARRVLREAARTGSTRIRFAAAFELANLGDRAALPVLVELLGASQEWIRYRANAVLEAIAGKSFGFHSGAAEKKRAAAILGWRAWLAGEGRTAKWTTPLKWLTTARGRTLVATYTNHKVHELNDSGEVVWTVTDVRTPWAVRGLADGHRLISSYSDNVVYEYDEAGKRIWQSGRLRGNITGLDRLPNGNVIVAIGTGKSELIEITRNGAVGPTIPLKGRPVSVRALPNGNLLVALSDAGAVVEVDPKGREVWRLDGLSKPYNADRLANGNVLIACYVGKRIAEYDRDKALVWERGGIRGLYCAEGLSDGSILFADKTAVHRQWRGGESIWSKPFAGNYLYIDRY